MNECQHPVNRLFAWLAHDDTLVVCCCDCGAVLAGAAEDPEESGAGRPPTPDLDPRTPVRAEDHSIIILEDLR